MSELDQVPCLSSRQGLGQGTHLLSRTCCWYLDQSGRVVAQEGRDQEGDPRDQLGAGGQLSSSFIDH